MRIVGCAAALLAHCVFNANSAETILHSFQGPYLDGGDPANGVILGSDGALYGTTRSGGTHDQGTIYKLNVDGTGYTVLRNFFGYNLANQATDGAAPDGELVQGSDGALYGTTELGGASGSGTIFKINTDGTGFTILHAFPSTPDDTDGSMPIGGLIEGADGALYGTAWGGGFIGVNEGGIVFKISKTGAGYTVLHSFVTSPTDGYDPTGRLVQGKDNVLYGTTISGGASGDGTIFKVATNGTGFAVLHSFNGSAGDGINPSLSPLIQGSDLALYGVTMNGGANNRGTIYKISTDGSNYSILRSFVNNLVDGTAPQGALLQASDGAIYGTTSQDGTLGGGTIYKINTNGTGYATVYPFTPASGAVGPLAGLIQGSDGTIYGTSSAGGSTFNGTVFSFSIAGPLDHFVLNFASSETNATPFSGTNTITAQDVNNNTVQNFDASTNNVTIVALSPLTGGVSGLGTGVNNKLNKASDFIKGVANLTALGMNYTGNSGTGTFKATSADSKSGTSGNVTINSGSLDHFNLVLASPQSNGVACTGTNTLTAADISNNTVSSFNASTNNVTLSVNVPLTGAVSGLGSGGNSVLNRASDFTNGVANLTALGLTYNCNAATGTLTATSANAKTGTSGSVTVNVGPLHHFLWSLAGAETDGVAFGGTNTLTALDSGNNTVTAFDASANAVVITAVSPLTGVVSGLGTGANNVLNKPTDFTNGVANLTALGMTYVGNAATGKFLATSATSKSGQSGNVAIAINSLHHFGFALAASESTGVPFAGSNTLTAQDIGNNAITTFDASLDNVTIIANAPLTGIVTGLGTSSNNVLNRAADFVNGVADLTALGLTYTGNIQTGTFTANSASSKTGTSGPVAVKLPQTITFNALSNVTYGIAPFPLTASSDSGLTVTFSVVSGPASITGNVLTITGAGPVSVQADQSGDATHSPAPPVTRPLTVTRATLTVTANDKTKVAGNANPAFTATLSGFVNGDTNSVVTGSGAFNTTATVNSPPGTYPITVAAGTLNAANYDFSASTYVGGTLTVFTKLLLANGPSAAPNPALIAQTVQFSCGSTLGGATFSWNFGDGTAVAGGVTVTHAFAVKGTYSVVVTASDAVSGQVLSGSVSVTVNPTVGPHFSSPLTANATQGAVYSYQLTATGTAPIAYSAIGLPSGLTLVNDMIAGTPTEYGETAIQLGASNAGGSTSAVLLLTIAPAAGTTVTPPTISSPPNPPAPTTAGQPVTLTGAADSAPGALIVYLWDFGDGTSGVGPTVSHTYTAAGVYIATLTITDGMTTTTQTVDVAVNAAGQAGTGFSVAKVAIKFSFSSAAHDTLTISGTIPVSAGFSPLDKNVIIAIGKLEHQSLLNAKGAASDKSFTLTGKLKSGAFTASPATFTITLKNQDLFKSLSDLGFSNVTVAKSGAKVSLNVIVALDGVGYQQSVPVTYTATKGKSGAAKK